MRFSARIRASLMSTTVTTPRARAGATRRSHAASPGARTARPRSSDTVTANLGSLGAVAVRKRFVRFDNLLDELVAHDVALVEVRERDSVDGADDLHRFDQAGHLPRRQV